MITIDISFKYFYSEVEQRRARRRGGDWKGSVKSKNMLEHKFMAFDLTEQGNHDEEGECSIWKRLETEMSLIPAEKEECGNVQTKRLDK